MSRLNAGSILLILALLGGGTPCASAANIFQTPGYWTNGLNWNGGQVPTNGEDVVIGANAILDSSPADLASLVVSNNCVLTFVGWSNTVLTATVVNIYGTITHTNESATTTNLLGGWDPDARVYIVCTNLTVASGGKVDVNGKGYSGGLKAGYTNACGPGAGGNGIGGSYDYNSGGSGGYGGRGGGVRVRWTRETVQRGGATYGSSSPPEDPGSGGGTGDGNGGAGGGVVRIDATDTVTVNGTISANGTNSPFGHGGGGSGGSVFINCKMLAGSNGVISADGGGTTGSGSTGGGGRISILYDTGYQSSVPGIRFSAVSPVPPVYVLHMGDIGTLYFPDNRLLTTWINHSGVWSVSGFTNWSPDSLTLSNAWIRFLSEGFHLSVTNNIVVMGTNAVGCRLEFTNAVVTCGGNLLVINASLCLYHGDTSGPTLNCGGDLVLTNAGRLYVYGGLTNGITSNYGALVNVAGDITVATNCWIYLYSHPTNGGSALFQMRNMTLSGGTNGGIVADGSGFAGAGYTGGTVYGPGKGGNGTGGGPVENSGGGGGFGGMGGGVSSRGGQTYGSSNAPVDVGSGGGSGDAGGGDGGGAVRIVAGNTVTLRGTIRANGANAPWGYGGGGSGGSIYISCRKFVGNNEGYLKANGGGGDNAGGGGGGGRIAVWRIFDVSGNLVSNSVDGGASPGGYPGFPGTVLWGWLPAPGTIFVIH